MPEHEGLPVHGYRKQPQEAVDMVNEMKKHEERLLRILDDMRNMDVDQRWASIGRTHLEQAFMAINRSIFKPERYTGAV